MERFNLRYKWDYYLSKATLYFLFFYMNSLGSNVVWVLFTFIVFNFLYFTRCIDEHENTWKDFYEEYVSDLYIQFLICLGHLFFKIDNPGTLWYELVMTYIISIVTSISIMLVSRFKNRFIGIFMGSGSFLVPSLFLKSINNIFCITVIYYLISNLLLLLAYFIYIKIKVWTINRS